jgi:hypothetical protein
MSAVDNFNKFKNGVNAKIYKALKQAGTLILADADKIIPIDTGFLANSKFQKENLNPENPQVVVGYTASYAAEVHENVGGKWKRPKAEAKFLEKSVNKNLPVVQAMIVEALKI